MDHWGDPWADDADTDTSANITAPAKVAHSPLHAPTYEAQTLTPAPIVLNGFLDDAGWGSNEWATTPSPRKDADAAHDIHGNGIDHAPDWDVHSIEEKADIAEYKSEDRGEDKGSSAWSSSGADNDQVPTMVDAGAKDLDDTLHSDAANNHVKKERLGSQDIQAGNEWDEVDEEVTESKDIEKDASEASFSSTETRLDDTHVETPENFATSDRREDDASTRSSESHSEESRNEVVAESPRTSVEETHTDEEPPEISETEERDSEEVEKTEVLQEPSEEEVEDEFGDFEDDDSDKEANDESDTQSSVVQRDPLPKDVKDTLSDVQDPIAVASADRSSFSTEGFVFDTQLIAELFPPEGNTPEQEDPPDDPVSSTSTRKAWYRLTRRQTMREYDYGSVDDNYIRVTWKTSHIRAEVNKTIIRWANEDRIAGRGPGARASFFWDSSAPPDQKSHEALHARRKPLNALPNPTRPTRESLPPLSTELPAAFNWSSPSSASHVTPNGPERRSTSTPISAHQSAIARLQRQGGRAVSVDLSPRIIEPPSHKRTTTMTDFREGTSSPIHSPAITPIQPPLGDNFNHWSSSAPSSPAVSISAPLPAPNNEYIDPWASLEALDTKPAPEQPNTVEEDDFDDWGEMVESPALSTTMQTPSPTVQTTHTNCPGPLTKDNSVVSTSTTPVSATVSPVQVQPLSVPVGPTNASRIVRLQGTVSPTSALFKPNALVPTDSEERIGPHLLKKTNKSQEAASERMTPMTVHMPAMEEVLGPTPAMEDLASVQDNRTSTPAISVSTTPRDSMSLQDSSQIIPAISSETATHASGDQPDWGNDTDFSIFESAVPSTFTPPPSSTPIATQSDPADSWSIFNSPAVSEPTMKPPVSTMSLAHKKKIEEDEAVNGIVAGLPDLRYMLKR